MSHQDVRECLGLSHATGIVRHRCERCARRWRGPSRFTEMELAGSACIVYNELVVRRKRIVTEKCQPCHGRVLQLITVGIREWSWGGPRVAASRISWTRVRAQTNFFYIFRRDMRAIRKLTYSLDRTLCCCVGPSLIVLGFLRDVNGLGVTQNSTITYHASVLPVSWPWLIFLCPSVGRLAAGTIKGMDRPP
jgi:hypothetical protein